MRIGVKCLTTCTDNICLGFCVFFVLFVLMYLCCFYCSPVKVKCIANMLIMDCFYISVRVIPLCCVPADYALRAHEAVSAQG